MHDYNTILGVIELRLSKVSYDSVQKRYRIGRSGIALIMNRYKDSGLSLDDLRQMPASKVVDLIYPKENLRHKDIPLPDFEKIHEQMIQMGKHADLSFLWIDYKKEHPNGYQLAQFYKLYRDFMVDTYGTSKTSMPVERIPGEKLYIDWVGDQPELLLDTATGELRKVHIFTTTLGFSSLVYAEIFLDEKLPHFIAGTVHALSYYGAVPKYLVPDNLRTAVTRHSKDELVLQSAFSDLETFYDTIILPPPPRKPKGKPTVENHVRFLETHLVEELKKDTYTSLEALNAAVKKIVADINQRPFQKKSDIRKSRMNGFDEYNRLICRHPRSYRDFPLYITDDNHMPPEHLYYKEVNAHDGAYYRRWASVYGESMVTLIDRILRSSKHEEQAYNSCAGVLHSCKDVPHRLVQEAAEKCVEANACKYSYFKKVLSMVQNNHFSSAINGTGKLPSHTNIRGKEAYK